MTELFEPTVHEALAAQAWSEAAARAAIAEIVADAEAAFTPENLWPNDPADLEGEPDRGPHRGLYLGAAGVLFALDELARSGVVELRGDYSATAAGLHAAYLTQHDFPELVPAPVPGLLAGEAGILLVADRLAPSVEARERLLACVRENTRNPTNEPMWGALGTMLAARTMLERGGDERFATAWRESADWLLGQWQDALWGQDLYGRKSRYVGPGHGFAGNVFALLARRDLLGETRAASVTARAAAVFESLAQVHDGLAQWPATGDPLPPGGHIRTQWCHGAAGMVISLAGVLPADERLTGLLEAGGELTWRAGPLRTGLGLCHGTAGNAYAFLALHRRTQDERWLERARRFALHAAGQVERTRAKRGRGRYTLFTGDVGVALALASCLDGDARFPGFDRL